LRCGGCEIKAENVLDDDRDPFGRKFGTDGGGHIRVQLHRDYVGGAGCQSPGDGTHAGTDFDDRAAGEVANGGCNALNGLRVVEEILSEFGLGWHGLF